MPTRLKFDDELEALISSILELGKIVEQKIAFSMESLVNQNMDLANTVVMGDLAVNDLQASIEEKCILLIATQQPFAGDLRKLVAGLKISIYLERMGDLSVDLAKITLIIGQDKLIKPLVNLPKMGSIVRDMLNKGLIAFVQEDAEAASLMALIDDEIDDIYLNVFKKLKGIMKANPDEVTQASYLIFAYRFIERMGDYCTNIAEEVVYLCSGKRTNLNK